MAEVSKMHKKVSNNCLAIRQSIGAAFFLPIPTFAPESPEFILIAVIAAKAQCH